MRWRLWDRTWTTPKQQRNILRCSTCPQVLSVIRRIRGIRIWELVQESTPTVVSDIKEVTGPRNFSLVPVIVKGTWLANSGISWFNARSVVIRGFRPWGTPSIVWLSAGALVQRTWGKPLGLQPEYTGRCWRVLELVQIEIWSEWQRGSRSQQQFTYDIID